MADLNSECQGPAGDYLVDGQYSIRDLIDIEGLRRIFEALSQLAGVAIGFNSHPSEESLIAISWADICANFHRAHPESIKACLKSNLSLVNKLKKAGDINIEVCDNGLVDGGTPIIIKDKYIATLYAGQVFLQKPDMETFKKRAQAYGYDLEKYLEAVGKVKIITEDRFKMVVSLLGSIASLITELGYMNLEAKNRNLALQEDVIYRENTELRLVHLNSVLRALSSISQLIIKEKDEKVLVSETCRILVESRNYRMAWIG
ncbi:MAG: PocR ligand-binding domain-containing protein, partial [Candidatus Omnitrophica bacterium]|nr:PocR ligand-binding domain-containing protein [Candidatus Omnitrophota bacterium]